MMDSKKTAADLAATMMDDGMARRLVEECTREQAMDAEKAAADKAKEADTGADGHWILWTSYGCWDYYEVRDGEVVCRIHETAMHPSPTDPRMIWLAEQDLNELEVERDDDLCGAVLDACGYDAADVEDIWVYEMDGP